MSRSPWWRWFHETRGRHRLLRVGVFVGGLVLVLLGATMWMLSLLLAVPPVFVGLWVWSREFHWGHRLFRAFLRRAESLWLRVRSRPVRWAVITLGGVSVAGAGYWAWAHFGLVGTG